MGTVPDDESLTDLLLKLKSDFRHFMRSKDRAAVIQDAYLDEMKSSGDALYKAIRRICESGRIVMVRSNHGGGRTHAIRTLGRLNPDGITVYYSSEPHAAYCLSMCVLLAAAWIRVVDSSWPEPGPPLDGPSDT